MTILGQHTVNEIQDLLAAKDYTIKQIKTARDTMVWTDPVAAADWDKDFAALNKRYDAAALRARAVIISTYATSGGAVPAEGTYQDVLSALSKIPGTTQKGDLQDLSNRLKEAGAAQDFSQMPQPKATDADLAGFKAADTTIKAGESAAGKAAPIFGAGVALATVVGIIGLGVAAKIYLPSVPHRKAT